MTEEKLIALLRKLQDNPALADKVRKADSAKAYIAVARDAGLTMTEDDLRMSKVGLSDAELEGAASLSTTFPTQDCRNTCPSGCTCSAILL